MEESEARAIYDSVALWYKRRQGAELNLDAMRARVIGERLMVCLERLKRRINLCRGINQTQVILCERAPAIPALRHSQKNLEVVLSARDLVEQVDMVDVRAPVDKIMLVPLPNCPHIVYPVVPSFTTSRPPLPPIFWPPPVEPPNRPPVTVTGCVPGVYPVPADPFAMEMRTPDVIV